MKKLITLSFISVLLASCGGGEKEVEADIPSEAISNKVSHIVKEKDGITLTEDFDHPLFADAELKMVGPIAEDIFQGENEFQFTLNQYQLGVPTVEENVKGCAYSEKGQHLHFILNNEPYAAKYESNFKAALPGGKSILLAFLSRSYHMSIKNPKAYVAYEFNVSADSSTVKPLEGEHLFYSRPKGSYSGTFAEKVLLDFYLVNTEISPEGNKVRVTINDKTVFTLDKWAPYIIEGLKEGKNSVKLELIDKDGKLIPGPFNDSGTRFFILDGLDFLK